MILYEAFGSIVSNTGSSANNRLANTKERDYSTGLDNHGFRYYDKEIGSYISRDPIGYGDGMNVYGYLHGNPVNFVDPLGLQDEEEDEEEKEKYDPIMQKVRSDYRFYKLSKKWVQVEQQREKALRRFRWRVWRGFYPKLEKDDLARAVALMELEEPFLRHQRILEERMSELVDEYEYRHLDEAGLGKATSFIVKRLGAFGLKGIYEACAEEDIYGRRQTFTERGAKATFGAVQLVSTATLGAKLTTGMMRRLIKSPVDKLAEMEVGAIKQWTGRLNPAYLEEATARTGCEYAYAQLYETGQVYVFKGTQSVIDVSGYEVIMHTHPGFVTKAACATDVMRARFTSYVSTLGQSGFVRPGGFIPTPTFGF